MSSTLQSPQPASTSLVLFTLLPGPGRRRADATYCYRLTYRGADEPFAGCVMTWEVTGGRQSYQVAVERDEKGELRLHCTCADAVFRDEEEGHRCKHIRGLLAFGSPGHRLVKAKEQPLSLRIWSGTTVPEAPLDQDTSRLGEVA
jgi:hypothetical protein